MLLAESVEECRPSSSLIFVEHELNFEHVMGHVRLGIAILAGHVAAVPANLHIEFQKKYMQVDPSFAVDAHVGC